MKDRIRQLMEAQHMNQQTFAQYTGIGSASLSSIFTGRTNPSLKHVQLIMTKFPDVNPLWLLQGQGGMLQTSGENSSIKPTGNSASQETVQPAKKNGTQGDLFETDNMAAQPTLFDKPLSSVTKPATTPNIQISQNGKRAITEIRIFYDDQTWESFVPKK